jgi:hypothetical protein
LGSFKETKLTITLLRQNKHNMKHSGQDIVWYKSRVKDGDKKREKVTLPRMKKEDGVSVTSKKNEKKNLHVQGREIKK